MALKVFISSKMTELRDVREIVGKALTDHGIEAFVYEESAGARPETVVITSLQEVEEADVYVGLFWQKYGEVTVQEYRHARKHNKPCFIYIRGKDLNREPELETFLRAEVYDLTKGVTYDYFDSAVQLGDAVARDVMAWLVRRYRELSAQVRSAEVSREEIERLQAEVVGLQAISQEPLPEGDVADNLARQLREWFGAIGYGLEQDVQRSGAYAELIINIPRRRRGYDRIMVRALDGEIEVSHVRDLRRTVDERKFDEGWLVCERRVSKAAREEAESHDNLFVYTFDQLIDEDVDWDRYFAWLENEVKTKGVDKYYVHLASTVDDISLEGEKLGTSRYENLDDYIDLWLDDPSKEHISILGEFGTGKTWSTLHYAYRMMQRYQEAKARGLKRPRVPLIIQLRNYARGFKDVGALLSEFVFREHEIGLPGYRAFEQLNRMGRLLLIFDGFDEMAARVDRQKMVNNFWELAKMVVPGSKAILTCRTEHFHYAQQEREVLRGELRASTIAIVLEAPKFEVVHLEMLRGRQVREALRRRTDAATVEAIMSNPELVDMARRPVLIEFILEALPEVQEGKPVDMAHIYYYAARRKMERDIKAERTFTSLADKLYFLCELSWEMLYTDQMSLNYKLFPERIKRYFGPKVAEVEEDHWHYDLLGQTMLVRDADGNYTPAHRSLLEFFVAYKFAAEMGALLPVFTGAACSQSGIAAPVPSQDYTWSAYFHRERDEQDNIQSIPMLRTFVSEPIERLATAVGAQPLTQAVLALMDGMVDAKRLWDIIEATQGCSLEKAGYTGGNAATLLCMKGEPFKGAKLARTVLAKANLFNTDLTAAILQEACLRGANLNGCTLKDTDLRGADLTNARLGEMGAVHSVAWSPDGRYLASGGKDTNVRVWDARRWQEVATLRAHTGAVESVCWSPDSREIGSTGLCNNRSFAIIWDIAEQQELMRQGATAMVYSPNGKYIAIIDDEDGTWKIVSSDWKPVWEHTVYDPVERLIPLCDSSGFLCLQGTHVFRMGITNGALTQELTTRAGIEDIATIGDKLLLATQRTVRMQPLGAYYGEESRLAMTRYYFDVTCVACGGNWVWAALSTMEVPHCIVMWHVLTKEQIQMFAGHSAPINSLACNPDGTLLASGSDDSTIRIWDIDLDSSKFGECVKVLQMRMNCNGMRVGGVQGLNAETLRFLYERGAELDDQQAAVVRDESDWEEMEDDGE